MGELLVTGLKDRIALAENQVVPFMRGDLTPGDVAEQLRRRGKGEEVVEKFQALYTELQEEIVRMKLEPSVRTAYMRAAFQVGGGPRPHDSPRLDLERPCPESTRRAEKPSRCAVLRRSRTTPRCGCPSTRTCAWPPRGRQGLQDLCRRGNGAVTPR